MKKWYETILKQRKWVVILFLAASLFAGLQTLKTTINPDISSYLSSDTLSKQTLDELKTTFDVNGDILIGIGNSDLSDSTLQQISLTLQTIQDDHPTIQEVDWIGNQLNRALFLQYNETMTGVNDLLLIPPSQWMIDPSDAALLQQIIHRYYRLDDQNHGVFLIYVAVDTPNTSDETFSLIDSIDSLLDDDYTDYYIGGTASKGKTMLDSALQDLPKFLTVAVVFILFLLLITTASWIEPFIFLLTIGIAILLNLGTNFFMNSVSTITFSAAAILQLALAMDYSIFLMHSYYAENQTTPNRILAMKQALQKTNRSITASALTTIGGFVALFVMKFQLGFDLGFVLAKGVLFSLISVLLFQPCLILMLDKWIEKTQHKSLFFHFKRLSKNIHKTRFIGVIAVLILFVPAIFLQSKVEYYYLDSRIDEQATGSERVVNSMGTQLAIIVGDADQPLKQSQFLANLVALNETEESAIQSIIGYYPLIQQISTIVDTSHPAYFQFQSMDLPTLLANKFIQANETYYILQLEGSGEQTSTVQLTQSIVQLMDDTFETYYAGGNSQIVTDFEKTTKNDFFMVAILSAIIIFFILLLTFKNLLTPLLLLLVIELGIFINLALTYLMGAPINFMSYLIISAIQLGATVDYAILLTSRYQESHDMEQAIQRSGMSIVVSIAILLSSCLSVYFIASDPIIKEITFLIAKGAVISGLLVLFVLPRLLIFIKKKEAIS